MKMAVVGCEASGKTVFMCALADYFGRDAANNPMRLKLTPENSAANSFERFQFRQMRCLHQWPPATSPERTIDIKWSLRYEGKSVAGVDLLEFGGETFRAAFRDPDNRPQEGATAELMKYLGSADFFVVLVSIKALLEDNNTANDYDFDRDTEALWVTRGMIEFIRTQRPDAGLVIGLTQADKYRNEIGEAGGPRHFFASHWPTVASAAETIPVVEVASVSKTDENGNPAEGYHTHGILPVMRIFAKHCFGNEDALENGAVCNPVAVGNASAAKPAPTPAPKRAVPAAAAPAATPAAPVNVPVAAVPTPNASAPSAVTGGVPPYTQPKLTAAQPQPSGTTSRPAAEQAPTNSQPAYGRPKASQPVESEKKPRFTLALIALLAALVAGAYWGVSSFRSTTESPNVPSDDDSFGQVAVLTVTNTIEKPVTVEKIVEKPVTNTVEKLVKVEVEKIVEKPVTNTVEKVVTTVVTNNIETIVETVVEKPVTNTVETVVEVEVEKIVEKPVTNTVEKVVEVEVEKIVEKPVTNTVEKIVEKVVEKVVTNVVEKVVASAPAQQTKATAAPTAKPNGISAEELAKQIPRGYRVWTDYNGRKIIAKWIGVSVDGNGITLLSRYNRRIDAVLWKFSADDQAYIKAEIESHAERGEVMSEGQWVRNPMLKK